MTSMHAVTYEKNRQIWLHAFGLTPWVATSQVASGPSVTLLSLAPTTNSTATKESVTVPVSAAPKETVTPPTPITHSKSTSPTAPAANTTTTTKKTTTAPKPVIYLSGHTLLVAEQNDRTAPELGREEQQLLRSLLHLFSDSHKPFSAVCPVDPTQAQMSFTTFVTALASQGCQQVLLCLSDATCQHLLGDDIVPYRQFTLGGINALVIASLADMLQAPLMHKRTSWNAICEANFVTPL